MKVLFINSGCGTGSTAKICQGLADEYLNDGHEVKIAYGRSEFVVDKYKPYVVRIGSKYDVKLHALKTRFTDKHGLGSKKSTKKFLEWAEKYSPDLLWLHNIHGYYINYELLFAWIKKHPKMEVRWTLHDCWAFTGHCAYYSYVECEKWKKQCNKCVQKSIYPGSLFFDNSENNFKRKKEAFTGVKNLTIVVPSQWLAEQVKQSFLNEYNIEVKHNIINTDIFRPRVSNFRERFGLKEKIVILGVASPWNERKGISDYFELARKLDDKYTLVMVGLNDKQMKTKPNNILGIKRTNDQIELSEIYSAADVFLNMTHEDNYPTVNLEARACGTPIITYNSGGSPESAGEDAIIVYSNSVDDVLDIIKKNYQ